MKRILNTFIALLFLAPASALAKEMDPQQVLSKIHHTNQMEMELGKLAVEKGQSEDVRRFGDRLYKDHKVADQKVIAMAKKVKTNLIQIAPTEEQKQTKEKLHEVTGHEFDREFLKAMEKGHQKDISMLESSVDEIDNKKLQKFVKKLLPVLKQHHHIAMKEEKELTKQAQKKD